MTDKDKQRRLYEHTLKGLELQKNEIGREIQRLDSELKSLKEKRDTAWRDLSEVEEGIAEVQKRIQSLDSPKVLDVSPGKPPIPESVKKLLDVAVDASSSKVPIKSLTKIDSFIPSGNRSESNIYQEIIDDIIEITKWMDWFGMYQVVGKLQDKYSKATIEIHIRWMHSKVMVRRNEAKAGPAVRYRLIEDYRTNVPDGHPFDSHNRGEKNQEAREAGLL